MKNRISVLLLIFALLIGFCSCNNSDSNEIKTPTKANRFYAVWLNYNELSMNGEADKSENSFRKKAEEIFINCNELGINRVIVQVRPFSDAFYNSELFPATSYLSGTQGVYIGYDALEIMCEYADRYNINIDAWINPYRVSYDADYTKLSENNPARAWIEQGRSDIVKITDNGIYYNPASIDAQRLVLEGVREILEKYELDGIHIDDYFYPTTNVSFDREEYAEYISDGGNLCLEDWRRENVNTLISRLYGLINSYKDSLIFSISPSGDIEKNYSSYYADIALWCREEGYCDLMIPQLYYGFENENKPFEKTLEQWILLEKCDKVKLAVGLAFYKYNSEDVYAGSGKNEWLENGDIISRQIRRILSIDSVDGFALYSYSYVFSKNNDEICKKELQIIKNMIQ